MIKNKNMRLIPSPGPRPYDDTLEDFFFGRDREINMILDYIDGQRLSVLTADSASGKTSLLQAGLVPILRRSRLYARKIKRDPYPPFPLLLNQWLSRAGSAHVTEFPGYMRLLVVEIDRYMAVCIRRYKERLRGAVDDRQEMEDELKALKNGRDEFRSKAEKNRLATITEDKDGYLRPTSLPAKKGYDDRQMLNDLNSILDVLVHHLGPVLLIIDQFEEVLMDPALGRQALVIVESIFQTRKDVKQFLSLRSDAINLLKPLERRGFIEGKRFVDISPLSQVATRKIVLSMSKEAELEWDDESLLDSLIDTFTIYPRDGGPAINVNMLGLQVVLLGLFTRIVKEQNSTTISLDAFREYCETLEGKRGNDSDNDFPGKWLTQRPCPEKSVTYREGILADIAPASWINQCLEIDVDDIKRKSPSENDDVIYEIIKPMVARMAEWLITPAGFKRPLTDHELEEVAFRKDLNKYDRTLAGRAKRENENWSFERLEKALANTCEIALNRLVYGHVLKKRGGEEGSVYYELVHDQFGRPLKSWADGINKSPEAEIGWPFAISDKDFQWRKEDRHLRKFVPEKKLRGVAWVGCALQDVDFSDLCLEDCDFTRTVFRNCYFDNSTLKNCNFSQALLLECKMVASNFTKCDFDRAAIIKGCSFTKVTFSGGSMQYIEINGAKFIDCEFIGENNDLLPMKNLLMINGEFKGMVNFENCSLDGATIGSEAEGKKEIQAVEADRLIFKNSDLSGMEMKNIRFQSDNSYLHIIGGTATGALFEELVLTKRKDEKHRGRFQDVTLRGAVFLGCELNDTEFTGQMSSQKADNLLDAKMIVFRHVGYENSLIPTTFNNVSFSDIDMENFNFIKCKVSGPIEFRRCLLSGGTIEGSDTDYSREINGPLRFLDNCDLAAIEFKNLSFLGRQLEISLCKAKAAFFYDVSFSENDAGEGALFHQTPLASALFLACQINGVIFQGNKNNPVSFEALAIKGNSNQNATIGACKFTHVAMDGFILNDVTVDGPVCFQKCHCDGAVCQNIRLTGQILFEESSLLRTKFSNIKAEGEFAGIDLRSSDLYYAELDNELLNSGEPSSDGNPASGSILAIMPEQLNDCREIAAAFKNGHALPHPD